MGGERLVGEQTQFAGAGNRLRATLDAELAEDVVDMGLDRAGGDDQAFSDLAIGETRCD